MVLNRILFCFYPLYVKWNHGIALLSALCKEKGIETSLYLLGNTKKFKAYLEEHKPEYVGFSCVTKHDYDLSLPFMRIAKESGAVVLLGGVYPRRGLPLSPPVDYICRGDGELLPQFIYYGDPAAFETIQLTRDLNSLPLPDYDLFRDTLFNREIPWLRGAHILPYHSSRGCPYRCLFCEVNFQTTTIRVRTRVEQDLTKLTAEYCPEVIWFMDELLPYYNADWRVSWGSFKHPFVCYIRADIKPELLEWLWDRGLVGVFFGVESGDEGYRNNILGKKLTDREIFRTVDLLQEMGVNYCASYMTHLPGETWPMMARTQKMAEKVGGRPLFYRYEDLTEAAWVQAQS